jgi:hypothetical protein
MKSEIGTYRPNGRSQMIAPKKLIIYQKQGVLSRDCLDLLTTNLVHEADYTIIHNTIPVDWMVI